MQQRDLTSGRLDANVTPLAEQIRHRLVAGLVAVPSDPRRQELFRRSTQTLASASVISIAGGDAPIDPDVRDQVRAALAVLASLASAEAEDAAAAVQRAVNEVLADAMRVGVAALIAALEA